MTGYFSPAEFLVFLKNISLPGNLHVLEGFHKTAAQLSGGFPQLHGDLGGVQDLLQFLQLFQVFFGCCFIGQPDSQKICIEKAAAQPVFYVKPGGVSVAHQAFLYISLQPIGVGITSYGKERIIYLKEEKTGLHIPAVHGVAPSWLPGSW